MQLKQRKDAVQRTGEYAMSLVGDQVLEGGAPPHPATEAKRVRTLVASSGSWTETEEAAIPTFRQSPPELVARFSELARP